MADRIQDEDVPERLEEGACWQRTPTRLRGRERTAVELSAQPDHRAK